MCFSVTLLPVPLRPKQAEAGALRHFKRNVVEDLAILKAFRHAFQLDGG
jgi:hypothetical protein